MIQGLKSRPATPPPPFSPEDIARTRKAIADVAAVENRMEPFGDHRAIRERLRQIPNAFARGEVSLETAIAAALTADASCYEVCGVLRSACKVELKVIYQGVRDLIARADAHRLQALSALAAKLQAVEMENAAQLGIENDNFQSSDLLESLRETISRETQEYGDMPAEARRGDFIRLATNTADLPDPTPTKAKRPALEMEGLLDSDELS